MLKWTVVDMERAIDMKICDVGRDARRSIALSVDRAIGVNSSCALAFQTMFDATSKLWGNAHRVDLLTSNCSR